MKTQIIIIATLALAFSISAFASQTTLTGVLTDDMCTKKHMMPGKPNADCVRDCTKHGAKYVVVSEGRVIELKADQEKLSDLAGKKIKVAGNLTGKTLVVTSIEAAQ